MTIPARTTPALTITVRGRYPGEEPGWSVPGRPEPEREPRPGSGQESSELESWLAERLFDQGIVLLQGELTAQLGTRVAAQLLAMEANDGERIQLHLRCPDGDLDA